MCGISGQISLNKSKIDINQLQLMLKSQHHRGPDDNGIYASDFVGLCHNRLSIIDTTSSGKQPMQTQDGRFLLVFNGEIFNYIELKRELEDKGRKFQTKTDSEVLLEAWAVYGEGSYS
jgi:asparagine synthase (glutamine-hydrolysing)